MPVLPNVLLVIDAAYAEYVSRNDYESVSSWSTRPTTS